MNFEIVWSERALRRLNAIRLYVAQDKPIAAEGLAIDIVRSAESLKTHPNLGHRASNPKLRELLVAGTPYVIIYRVLRRSVLIATIWHAAQRKTK
ncbi:MAG: type II toxin-antitoxin system RelE/ParE family toxin [Acidobacteria bacterium]|nr:type II toxin-antitoxin system RelE/ParE family toxin [Acidobacteriota bacterium]